MLNIQCNWYDASKREEGEDQENHGWVELKRSSKWRNWNKTQEIIYGYRGNKEDKLQEYDAEQWMVLV